MSRLYIALIAVFMSFQAQADKHYVGAERFETEVLDYLYACDEACKKDYREELFYFDGRKVSAFLQNGVFKKLNKIAQKQAYIWMDTVLARDYHTSGVTKLEQVHGLFYRTRLVGYKITYSEEAWDISACRYDEDDALSSLEECAPGVIRESSFVAPDLKTYFRNYNEMADFEESLN